MERIKSGVVALLESQRSDNKAVKTDNYWFAFVL